MNGRLADKQPMAPELAGLLHDHHHGCYRRDGRLFAGAQRTEQTLLGMSEGSGVAVAGSKTGAEDATTEVSLTRAGAGVSARSIRHGLTPLQKSRSDANTACTFHAIAEDGGVQAVGRKPRSWRAGSSRP